MTRSLLLALALLAVPLMLAVRPARDYARDGAQALDASPLLLIVQWWPGLHARPSPANVSLAGVSLLPASETGEVPTIPPRGISHVKPPCRGYHPRQRLGPALVSQSQALTMSPTTRWLR